ncbi:MAG: adenine deaminase, partial [Leptolyngbyaceae cyanobacterium MO_188.B28]|nr:adenine deaminase [Leptolyngbyaceae cyanobacterium MO_188.B28]
DADHTIGAQTTVMNARGLFLSPGLMDTHVHIEASMVTPTQFARVVLPRGNTAVNWETLWTANVLGIEGIQLLLTECNHTPLKFFATAAQGVPCASPRLVTPAQEFSLTDLEKLLAWRQIVGLGEVVLFNELLQNDPKIHQEIRQACVQGKTIDGSAPEFRGKELNAYVAAGIQSDHEAISLEEAIERIRLGMRLVIREGSSMRNLTELIKVITEKHLSPRRCCFCVDDKDIREIAAEGLVDDLVRKAIKTGVDPVTAVQMASLNPAEYFGVDRDIGGIAPGKIADILLVEDLENFTVQSVIVNGQVVAEEGRLRVDLPTPSYPSWMMNTVQPQRKLQPQDFTLKTDKDKENQTTVHVIKVFREQIISIDEAESLPVTQGEISPDTARDILKMAVIERHGKTTPMNIARGLVRGFGLTQGAIASSISPDIHQIVVVGVDDADMATAVNRLIALQGGIVVCRQGEILSELPLPVGGLMSEQPYEQVINELNQLSQSARQLGCDLPSPFMTLAFAGCPTLTEFKLSDKGLIDVTAGKLVPLELG